MASVDLRILGPVEVAAGPGRVLPVSSAKMRFLTAMLLLHAGRVVSTPRLTAALWNGEPPDSAQKNLQQYVHRLRGLLAAEGVPDRIVSRPGGYLLRVDPGERDLDRFEALVATGRRARERGDPRSASASLREALALWRGDPLADVRDSLVLDEAAQVLDERRLHVVEERIGIELTLGWHSSLVSELDSLVARYPLRERLREQHMLALYGAGRTADALASYRKVRAVLADELGIDPGPGLRRLLAAILAEDSSVLGPRPGMARVTALSGVRLPRRRILRRPHSRV